MLIKTRRTHLPRVESVIVQLHPYDVPEVLTVDVSSGHGPYLDWLRGETAKPVAKRASLSGK